MELSVSDRLILLSVLPKEGDITTLRITRELKEDLSFDLAEHDKLKFVNEGELVKWDDSEKIIKEVNVDGIKKTIIRDSFNRLNNSKKLREEHITLYEKFVEEK